MGKKETAVEKMKRKMEQKDSQLQPQSQIQEDDNLNLDDTDYSDTNIDTDFSNDELREYNQYQENEIEMDGSSTDADNITSSLDYNIDPYSEKYDKSLIHEAINQGLKNPRVGAWSPTSAMILNYIKYTRPRYGKSISSEIDEILAESLKNRYPDLYEAIENCLREKNQDIPKVKGIKK